jgi:hypothetical protein
VRHSLETEVPRAFDLHVLGMPPAFVLSQDQTLKFIPGPSVLTCTRGAIAPRNADPGGQTQYQGLQNARKMRKRPATRAAARASLPIFHNLNQQTPSPKSPGPRPKGRCLYPPPLPTVNHSSLIETTSPVTAQTRSDCVRAVIKHDRVLGLGEK